MTLYLHAEQTAELARLGYPMAGIFDAHLDPELVEDMREAIAAFLADGTAYQVAASGPNREYFAFQRRVRVLSSIEHALNTYLQEIL